MVISKMVMEREGLMQRGGLYYYSGAVDRRGLLHDGVLSSFCWVGCCENSATCQPVTCDFFLMRDVRLDTLLDSARCSVLLDRKRSF
jgi:hypothetical protein